MKRAAPSSTCAPRSKPCTRDLNTRLDTKSDKSATLDILNQHEQTMQEIAQAARPDRSAGQRDCHRPEAPERLLRRPRRAHRKLEPRQEVTIDGKTAEVDRPS
jgi:hypothetical protein